MSTVREILLKGRACLQCLPQINPLLEAKLLLLKSASLSEEEFFAYPEKLLPKSVERRYLKLIAKRLARHPLPYLTGVKEFWSIPFHVFPGVFIPRPETELIVDKVVELSSKKKEIILDIGTGCGNIAITLARKLPQAQIMATDIHRKALRAARLNAAQQNIVSLTFVLGSLFSPLKKFHLEGKCDFIVSNPPYVSEDEWAELEPEIKEHEPKRALVPGETGLEFISQLIAESFAFLKSSGRLLFEIGKGQSEKTIPLFDSRWKAVKICDDLRRIPRVVIGCKE